jgi:hypothetical protein
MTYLADRRLTFELKCAGLDAHGMAARSVPPSNLSLAGLVRHLAGVERYWFRRVMAGEVITRLYTDEEEFDGVTADPAGIAAAWADWRAEVTFAEQFVEHAPDLGIIGLGDTPLREVLVHLIEEYARHNGHADLLRECIDGRVGQ